MYSSIFQRSSFNTDSVIVIGIVPWDTPFKIAIQTVSKNEVSTRYYNPAKDRLELMNDLSLLLSLRVRFEFREIW